MTAADKDDIEIVKAKFKAYFTPRVNETYERYKFLKRKQEQGETFESFLTDLKNLVSSCGYHVEEKSKVLRDQIVMGVVSNVVREKLLDQAALTLNTAVDLCRSSEVTGQLMMGMSATNDPIQPVHAVKQKGHRSTHTNRSDKHVHKNNHKCCKYCGNSHEPRKCQAYGRFCNKCGMKNHYANCCDHFSKNDNKTPVHSVEHNNDNTHSIVFSVKEQFDKTLSDMESNKIITKVTEPTEWVNPIVTVRKPSGALRICLDPLELNKAIRREHYSIPTPGEIVVKIARIEILQYARCYFGVSANSARRRQ